MNSRSKHRFHLCIFASKQPLLLPSGDSNCCTSELRSDQVSGDWRPKEALLRTRALAASILAIGTVGAQGADYPVKAPLYKAPAVQVYDWTGPYVGVNVGGSVGRSRTHTNDPGAVVENETTYLSAIGAIGGGQIGYNWQIPSFLNLVLGLEADIQASGQRGSACLANCLLDGTITLNLQQKIDWFGTARARVGLASGPVLSYVTAGFAYGHVSTGGSFVGFAPPAVPFSLDKTRGGFAVGSGMEASLGGNWTAKIEYLFIDLGQSNALVDTGPAAVIFGTPVNVSAQARDHIYRGGLNYRFGGNDAFSAPLASWGGLYIGGNTGSMVARNPSTYAIGPGGVPPNLETFDLAPTGYSGGVQIGYNWQAGMLVLGVEADIQGSTARDQDSCVLACTDAAGIIAFNQRVSYFGTARGRIGYAIGPALFYATAGFAYGETKTDIWAAAFPPQQLFSFKHKGSGYAVGGGIEAPLQLFGLFGPSWTAKTEYLYLDLGRSSDSLAPFGSVDTFTSRTQAHVFRSGINYHFNAPVIAKY
jgi:outer membrane immunogenic protein